MIKMISFDFISDSAGHVRHGSCADCIPTMYWHMSVTTEKVNPKAQRRKKSENVEM